MHNDSYNKYYSTQYNYQPSYEQQQQQQQYNYQSSYELQQQQYNSHSSDELYNKSISIEEKVNAAIAESDILSEETKSLEEKLKELVKLSN